MQNTKLGRIFLHTIFLMASPHVQVDVAFPAMVRSICVAEFGDPRPWVLCERVEEKQMRRFRSQGHQNSNRGNGRDGFKLKFHFCCAMLTCRRPWKLLSWQYRLKKI